MALSHNQRITALEAGSGSGSGSGPAASAFIGGKFYMSGVAALTVFQSGVTIGFNTVDYNLGGGTFDTATSIYTIPADGVYMFVVRLAFVSSVTSSASIGLYLDDQLANPLYRNGKLGGNSENLTTTHNCTVGQRFRVRVATGPVTIETGRPWSEFIVTKM